MDFYRERSLLIRYVDFPHVVWHSMVDCFVLFLVRMERIKRIGLVAAIRQKSRINTYPLAYCPPGRGSYRGLSWHTSFVGVPGYSWYCPPGSRVLCEAACDGTALAEYSVKLRVMVLPSRQSAMCCCV